MDQNKLLAAIGETDLGKIGEGGGLGPFGGGTYGTGIEGGKTALEQVTKVISNVVGIMTVAASIWFLFNFLVGGFSWITAGGDKGNLEKARHRMTDAFIGFVIVVAAWIILALMGQFFGYDILIGDPRKVIEQLGL